MWRPLRTARQHRLLVVACFALVLALAIVVSVLLTFGGSGEGNGQVEELPPPPVHHPPPAHAPSPPSPPSVSHRARVENGAMVVDGRPFFPMMSWGECTNGFETSLPVGTNLYAGSRCGGLEAQLPALDGHALSAAVAGEAVPAHADVIGVFYPDEADARGMTGNTLPEVPSRSGIRFLTLSNHFYSGSAPLSFGRGVYPRLVAKADVVGFDLYPLQVWCRPDRLVDVYLAQKELGQLAAGKPTFQWIEAAGMSCPHDGPTAVTRAPCGPSRGSLWRAVRAVSASSRRLPGRATSGRRSAT